eukprot:m.84514 g.84514  ORF g.84514 m.84514 type:complete len:134 (-) comp12749_c0_seq5:119-520(-)
MILCIIVGLNRFTRIFVLHYAYHTQILRLSLQLQSASMQISELQDEVTLIPEMRDREYFLSESAEELKERLAEMRLQTLEASPGETIHLGASVCLVVSTPGSLDVCCFFVLSLSLSFFSAHSLLPLPTLLWVR